MNQLEIAYHIYSNPEGLRDEVWDAAKAFILTALRDVRA